MKKIDIHCHVTNRVVEDIIPKSASIDAVLGEMEKYDIEKTALLASYFPHKGSGISNFRLLNWINGEDKFHLFGSIDIQNYFHQGMNELYELASLKKLDGVKIYTCYQEIEMKSPQLKEVVGLAKKFKLPLMFHTGYSYSTKRRYGKESISKMVSIKDLEFLARENPEVNIIASHMSKPFFNDVIKVIRRNTNLYTDVSGLIDSKYNQDEIPKTVESIKEFLENCGPDKLLFGTDFPVQTHKDSIYFVEESMKEFSEGDKKKVYYHNARRLLGK